MTAGVEKFVELRQPTSADRDTIAEIWHASASLPEVGPPRMPTKAELRKRVDEEFAGGWHVALAARDDDVLGFVAMKPIESVLAELFVRPGSTGGGIGRLLLDHVKAVMPDGFTLYTRSANTGARRFYEREGLVALRDGTHPRSGDPIIYYGFRLRL